MLTIEKVSATLQQALGEAARHAGRESGFIQRERKLDGASFVQTLVFGWMANPQASLEELSQAAATCGVEISAQGLDARFSAAAAACLKLVLEKSLTYALDSSDTPYERTRRFAGIYIQDSTVIGLPAELAAVWAGCGNQNGAGAGLKLQTMLEYQRGRLSVSLHAASEHDSPLQRIDLPTSALRLADMGYFDSRCLAHLTRQGVFWLTRLPAKLRVWETDGHLWTLSAWLETYQQAGRVDRWVSLTAQGLRARLVAQLASPQVVAQRQEYLIAQARRRGRAVSSERLALCRWTLCATNLCAEHLPFEDAFILMRLRWQIELLFKLWKAQAAFTAWRSSHPWRILCEVYAKLLAVVVQHWLLLIGCWHVPDRSLVKATQTLRKHAFHLASVLSNTLQLIPALRSISRAIARCRIHTRKACPATFQRLASLSP